MRKISLILLLTLFIGSAATAQTEALVKAGLFGDLGFSTGKSVRKADCCPDSEHSTTIFGLNAGFLLNPKMGVGLELQSRKPEDIDATYFVSPRVLAVPMRQGEKYPVTVSTGLVLHLVMPPGDNVSAKGFGVRIGVSRSMAPMKGIGILPHLSLRYSSITYSYDTASKGLASSDSKESPVGFVLGVTGSAKYGPGLITATPFFELSRYSSGEGTSESTSTTTQVGLKVGLSLTR